MLQNTPTLAIGGLDTSDNGRSKFRQMTNIIRQNVGRSRDVAAVGAESRLALLGGASLLHDLDFLWAPLGLLRSGICGRAHLLFARPALHYADQDECEGVATGFEEHDSRSGDLS